MKKNYLYSLLVATSLTSMMSCAHATDLTQDEDQRPLFTRGEERHFMTNLVETREACTTAVARQIGADNARIVVEEERDDLLLVLVRKDEEIVGLHQAAGQVRANFERQIQELNQTCARLAALAMNSENAHRNEVQVRQIAESTLLVVQQERDAETQARQRATQERDDFAREIAQLRADADLRRQLAQSESARDLEARQRMEAQARIEQMEAARVQAQRVEAARVEAARVEAERLEAARLMSIQIDENQARNLLSDNVNSMTNEQRQRELQILNNIPISRLNDLRIAQLERLIQGL